MISLSHTYIVHRTHTNAPTTSTVQMSTSTPRRGLLQQSSSICFPFFFSFQTSQKKALKCSKQEEHRLKSGALGNRARGDQEFGLLAHIAVLPTRAQGGGGFHQSFAEFSLPPPPKCTSYIPSSSIRFSILCSPERPLSYPPSGPT